MSPGTKVDQFSGRTCDEYGRGRQHCRLLADNKNGHSGRMLLTVGPGFVLDWYRPRWLRNGSSVDDT